MKPNVLILHADQHRQDCIGVYGNPDVKTPNIDSIAEDGVLYNSHFTVYPVCTPSRYSMLSGLYVHKHNAWSNESTLPDGFATFPKVLRDNGYKTACVGKMHMTPVYHDVGYSKMVLAEQNGEGRYEDDYHTYLMENDLIDSIDLTDQVDSIRQKALPKYYDHFGAFESDLSVEHHSTSWITRQAIADINEWNEDGGNLLMVGYIKPHHPFDPPHPYSEMYDPSRLTILDGYTPQIPKSDEKENSFFDYSTLSEQRLREIMANYYGTITQIDDNIGEILNLLKEKKLYDNTMIIYTSDHGEYLGFHHMLLKGNHLYDPLARIPLIIKYPSDKGIKGAADAISENIDIASTILKCCNLPVPTAMTGLDLSDYENGREFAFSEGQYGGDQSPSYGYMVRSNSYKLLVNGSMDNFMFFDLLNDPCEADDLAQDKSGRYQEEIERHKKFLIDTVLFASKANNHCCHESPSVMNPKMLKERADTLKVFIDKKLNSI